MGGGRQRPAGGSAVRAWRPAVAGIVEVFHATFVDHSYPMHTHDAWTLLIVDDGVISYDLDGHEHGVVRPTVTLLPPDVPHDGGPATPRGFRKRVAYLDRSVLPEELVGKAVDQPGRHDPVLRRQIDRMHRALAHPGESLAAESLLALVLDALGRSLRRRRDGGPERVPAGLAERMRDLLDASMGSGLTLRAAAETLEAHPTHLVRAFSRRFGLPPHRYLTGRRVDAARRLLLAGWPVAEVAAAVGFYDQAHLTRHFRRYLGVSPARYRGSVAGAGG